MNVWLIQHRNALRLAVRRLTGAPVNTALSLLTFGIALALPIGGLMVYSQAQQAARGSSALPQISVFMHLDADQKAANDTKSFLKRNPAIASVVFVPRESTLARMRKSEGLADVIDALPRNPFPDAFVVTPVDSGTNEMERLASQLKQLPQVAHVQIDSAWLRRLNSMLGLARAGLGILSLLLGAGLIAVTFNTIRLQVLTHRNEIEVSQLLGATDAFIRRPFIYFGMLQGVLGGLAAWLIIAGAIAILHDPLLELASLYSLNMALSPPGGGISFLLFLTAAGLGWLGTLLSLSQHLRRTTIDR